MKSLYAEGTLLFSDTQNTSDFAKLYNPGSMITGLALCALAIKWTFVSKYAVFQIKPFNMQQSLLSREVDEQHTPSNQCRLYAQWN